MCLRRILLALVLGASVPLAAQSTDPVMRRLDDIELLQRRMQQQLDEIKQLLVPVPRSAATTRPDGIIGRSVSILNAPAKGNGRASAVIIEIGDFQCPYCGQFHRTTYPEIMRRFVDSGKVLYVFKNFPLENAHPFALRSAQAAVCAGQQSKFWEMHHQLFDHQNSLAPQDLRRHAQTIGLDIAAFDNCFLGQVADQIRADQAEARELGVNQTPTILIGTKLQDGGVRIRQQVTGAVPIERFLQLAQDFLE